MKYIHVNNLPPNPHLITMAVMWLLLDRFNAPGWVYGVGFTIVGLISIAEICRWVTGKAIDLVGNDVKPIKDEANKN